ncbi:MAG: hypothetical protein K8R18_09745 [Parvibaculum sp.]|uniref:hypothetical protein n=1 Tax=Parvibaculum sp. TaxID=2024848 RepID=UPI0025F438B5|nr:hypothetical protein [Parvibaculum sp.]MCE9649891.1 hypothetical protein [Parvibaculum sp.]
MIDMASIQAAAGSIKAAAEITNALLKLKIGAEIQSRVVDLNTQIIAAQVSTLAAQADQFALLEQVRELEKQVAALEAWETEKQRYELTEVGPGVFAYKPKSGMEGTEPAHKICANCYQDAHISILQAEVRNPGRVSMLVCNQCGSELILSGSRGPETPRPTVNRGQSKWAAARRG